MRRGWILGKSTVSRTTLANFKKDQNDPHLLNVLKRPNCKTNIHPDLLNVYTMYNEKAT
jgi:hypothetical protein